MPFLGVGDDRIIGNSADNKIGVNTIILENAIFAELSIYRNVDDWEDLPEWITVLQLFPGARGLAKLGGILFIDLNANGQIYFRNDISIFNFFNQDGSGNFDQVGNLSGDDIVEFFDNFPAQLQGVGKFLFPEAMRL